MTDARQRTPTGDGRDGHAEPGTRGDGWISRSLGALACATTVMAMQSLAFAMTGLELGGQPLFHLFLVVLVFQLAVALIAGIEPSRRLWSAIVFWAPITSALSLGLALGAGLVGAAALLVVAGACSLLWIVKSLHRGVPWLAAAAGGALGAAISVARAPLVGPGLGSLAPFILGLLGLTLLGLFFARGRVRAILAAATPTAYVAATAGAAIIVVGLYLTALARQPETLRIPTRNSPQATAPPPIVLIVLDTLRADRLSLYGYERQTMPTLARFVDESGARVLHSIANGSQSLTSHASLFTGLYPPRHGAHLPFADDPEPPQYGYPLDDAVPTLAELLRRQGYWTVGISANFGPLSPSFGLDRGFDHYRADPSDRMRLRHLSPWILSPGTFPPIEPLLIAIDRRAPFSASELFTGPAYLRAEEITDRAIDVVNAAETEPFFLFLNYFDPHLPYSPPGDYRFHYPGYEQRYGALGLRQDIRNAVLSDERDLTEEEREHVDALYDGELLYLDQQLGRLFTALREHPRWQEMMVIITSDHGEALGEHRLLDHSVSVYSDQVWVPLVIRPAPSELGLEESPVLQSVDVFSTALAHAGVDNPPDVDGSPWGIGRSRAYSWLYVLPAFLRYPNGRFNRELASVQEADKKAILSSTGVTELYLLSDDPGELSNRAGDFPEELADLVADLEAFKLLEKRSTSTEEPSAEAIERLRSLGYVN